MPVYNTSKIVYTLSEPGPVQSPVHSPVQSRVQVLYHPEIMSYGHSFVIDTLMSSSLMYTFGGIAAIFTPGGT